MRSKFLQFIALLIVASAPIGNANATPATENEPAAVNISTPSLAKGKGLVKALCTACHSQMVIANAAKSRKSWEQTFEKMEKQGMAKLPTSMKSAMLDFLSTNQGPAQISSRANRGPWADQRNANPL